MERLPYIDLLLQELRGSTPENLAVLGRHIHLGYWSDPAQADGSFKDFAAAAERLSWMVCEAGGVQNGHRILDVGCGIGGTAHYVVGQGWGEVTGIDLDPANIEVSMDDGILSVAGERQAEERSDVDGIQRYERVTGRFYRRFTLPESADAEAITAKTSNGILEITIPKMPEVQARRITVEAA